MLNDVLFGLRDVLAPLDWLHGVYVYPEQVDELYREKENVPLAYVEQGLNVPITVQPKVAGRLLHEYPIYCNLLLHAGRLLNETDIKNVGLVQNDQLLTVIKQVMAHSTLNGNVDLITGYNYQIGYIGLGVSDLVYWGIRYEFMVRVTEISTMRA